VQLCKAGFCGLSAAKQQLRIAETLQCAASSFQLIWIMWNKRTLA
jgi:hypothetical protein